MRSGRALLGIASMALLLSVVPPAHATSNRTVVFVGNATLTGGLSYPCLPACPQGVPGGEPGDPLVLSTPSRPLRILFFTIELGTTPFLHGGNARSFILNTTLCANTGANVSKLSKAPAHAGACALTGSGYVRGWCGLTTGEMSGTFVDASGEPFAVSLAISSVGSALVVRGHWFRITGTTHDGFIAGAAVAVPLPVVTGTTTGNSCASGTANNFTIAGSLAFVPV